MLQIKNLTFSYQNNKLEADRNLFEDFSLDVRHGETVAILGRSGCGKTTLINIIAGYLNPYLGSVKINGKEISGPGRDRIVINQENDLFNWMTVYQNMKITACDGRDSSIMRYLKMVGLETTGKLYPHQLSGGMKKKLSLARALAAKPRFLILDEPFASLDHANAERIQTEFSRIVDRSSITVLLVTHNIDEAIMLSDKIIVIDGQPIQKKAEFAVNIPNSDKNDIKTNSKFKLLKEKIRAKL